MIFYTAEQLQAATTEKLNCLIPGLQSFPREGTESTYLIGAPASDTDSAMNNLSATNECPSAISKKAYACSGLKFQFCFSPSL